MLETNAVEALRSVFPDHDDEAGDVLHRYQHLGYTALSTSTVTGEGIDEWLAWLEARRPVTEQADRAGVA